mgnify:CR=1 FL=1|jgi:triosephosphate isomerase (TIM)
MIFLNFKTYPETSGQKAVNLCQIIQNTPSPVKITPCLQTADLKQVTQQLDFPVWTQHLDTKDIIKQKNFITGTLLNHSNHSLKLKIISQTLALCHQHQLKVMVITDSLDQIEEVTKLHPDYLGFEDPKLIGGPTPMVQAHPELIKKAVNLSQQPLIVGGGIRSREDIKKSLKLGAKGVLIASEFAKSNDPQKTLKDLIQGFN